MENQSSTAISSATRKKSALYPAVTIKESYEFIRLIDSFKEESVPYERILQPLGLTCVTTRSFLSRIGASKQFGFITTGRNKARLTEFARRILDPERSAGEVKQLLIEAFEMPPLYTKLIERYNGKSVPAKGQLSNILMNEYHIIKQVKDRAAACFIESAEHLGLLANGILSVNMEHKMPEMTLDEVNPEILSPIDAVKLRKSAGDRCEEGYNFEIPTLGKRTARFYIPAGITAKDLDYLKLCVENMLPAFLENLKSEL